jgi:hypothetical protein
MVGPPQYHPDWMMLGRAPASSISVPTSRPSKRGTYQHRGWTPSAYNSSAEFAPITARMSYLGG